MVVGSIGTYMQTPERSLKLDYNLEQVNPCVYDCAATTCGFPKDGIFKWEKELWEKPWLGQAEGGGDFLLVF